MEGYLKKIISPSIPVLNTYKTFVLLSGLCDHGLPYQLSWSYVEIT